MSFSLLLKNSGNSHPQQSEGSPKCGFVPELELFYCVQDDGFLEIVETTLN